MASPQSARALWTPANLNKPAIGWWSPSRATTSGSSVSTIPNQGSMGTALDLVSINAPTYNANGFGTNFVSIEFNGSNTIRATNTSLTSKTYVYYGTVRIDRLQSTQEILCVSNQSDYPWNGWGRASMILTDAQGTNTITAQRGSSYSDLSVPNGPAYTVGTPFLVKAMQDPSGEYVDMNAVHTQAAAYHSEMDVNFAATCVAYGCSSIDFYQNHLQGAMGTGVLLDYMPTQDEEDRILGYIAWSDNQQTKLPVTHTYYTAAPTTAATTRRWTPSQDLGSALVAHWDAQQGVTESNGAVSQWLDTIAGISAVPNGPAPTYSANARNNKPGLTFDGNSCWLQFTPPASFPTGLATSTIATASYNPSSNTGHVFVYGNFSGGQLRSQNDRGGFVGGGNGASDQTTSVSSVGIDRFSVWQLASTASSFIIDGVAAGSATLTPVNTGLDHGRIGTYPNQTEFFTGVIQQVLVINRALTADEELKIEGWESWYDGKNGTNLPAGHPYKNSPPMVVVAIPPPTRLWMPEDLGSALAAHWDAKVGVTLSNGNVSSWVDRVSGITAVAGGTGSPTYLLNARNNQPGLVFDGSSQYLDFPGSAPMPIGQGADCTVALGACNYANDTNPHYAFGFGQDGNNATHGVGVAGNQTWFTDNLSQNVTGAAWNYNQDMFLEGVLSSQNTASAIFSDGVAGPTSGAFATLASSGGRIGRYPTDAAAYYFQGVIQQILVFRRALTATERALLEGWESWYDGKNGSNLQANHPYKNAAPVVPATDVYFNNVGLLLHFDGANASTIFRNTGTYGAVVHATGSAAITTTQARYGSGSVVLDGSNYLIVSALPRITYNDYTIEAWINPQANGMIFDFRGSSGPAVSLSGNLVIYQQGNQYSGSTNVSLNAWHHIALVRQANTMTLYLDGVVHVSCSATNPLGQSLTVGAANDGTNVIKTCMDEIRITNGVARYTGPFTPPAAASPDLSAVSFVTRRRPLLAAYAPTKK